MQNTIVEFKQVDKEYPLGKLVVKALQDINLTIDKGEFSAVVGPSGSGKTTLLNLIGCIDLATRGTVTVDSQPTGQLKEKDLTQLRLHKLGFIFQTFNLVPVLTVFQNVEFPLLLKGGFSRKTRQQRVNEIIDQVGLTDQIHHHPNELSGGQRQRVAIARALVSKPSIVLADEPTGNLDSATGLKIIELMKELNKKDQTTFIFSTHDPRVMQYAKRVVYLEDGRISDNNNSLKNN